MKLLSLTYALALCMLQADFAFADSPDNRNPAGASFAPQPLKSKTILSNSGGAQCLVGLRLIRGDQLSADRATEPGSTTRLHFGPGLNDVQNQLTPLPFKTYQMLEKREQTVSLKEAVHFSLNSATNEQQMITVRPLSMMGRKVHVMLDWQGADGQSIVSTKMKFNNGESMVLGADGAKDTSTIVCVNVNCR